MAHKIPKPPPDLLEYFKEIGGILSQAQKESEDGATNLIENALAEAEGKELALACCPAGSRALQLLLSSATEGPQLLGFLEAVGGTSFVKLITNAFGSHVAETLLSTLAAHLSKSGATSADFIAELEACLGRVCRAVTCSAEVAAFTPSASHALRRLLAILAGGDLTSNTTTPSGGKGGGHKGGYQGGGGGGGGLSGKLHTQGGSGGGQAFVKKHHRFSAVLRSFLLDFARAAVAECPHGPSELWECPAAGPLAQVMVEAAAAGEDDTSDTLETLLSLLLGGRGTDGGDGESGLLSEINEETWLALAQGTGGSRILEAALKFGRPSLRAQLYTSALRNQLPSLAAHPAANFVVQTFFATVQEGSQVKLALTELEPHIGSLLRSHRGGVVASLLAATARLQVAQKEACQAIARGVTECATPQSSNSASEGSKPGQTGAKNLVARLLTLEARGSGDADFNPLEALLRLRPLSTVGSALLKLILGFSLDCQQQFSDSLASLAEPQAVAVASDPGGSHCVEALVEGPASPALKKRLITKLQGNFAQIATAGGFGVRCVETCYKWSEISVKESIAAELDAVEAELAKSRTGSFLLQRCGLSQLKNRPDEWRRKEEARTNMRSEFNAMFADPSKRGDGTSAYDGGQVGTKRKYSATGMELNEDNTNLIANETSTNAAEQPTGGRKKRKKPKKKKKPKSANNSENQGNENTVINDSAVNKEPESNPLDTKSTATDECKATQVKRKFKKPGKTSSNALVAKKKKKAAAHILGSTMASLEKFLKT